MKLFSFLLFLVLITPPDFKEHKSVTEVYTITIPQSWEVEVQHKKTEIYFGKGSYIGQFEISVRPFLVSTNAKSEFYELRGIYEDALLSRINDVQVVTCTLVDDENKEYNWVFYHDKYEIWCQYTAFGKLDHTKEIQLVQTAINKMQFFEIE
jgi:hypothetical protein